MERSEIRLYAKNFIEELVDWEVDFSEPSFGHMSKGRCWYSEEGVRARNLQVLQDFFAAGKGRDDFWSPNPKYNWMESHLDRMRLQLLPVLIAGSYSMSPGNFHWPPSPTLRLEGDEKWYMEAKREERVDLQVLSRAFSSDFDVHRYYFDILRFVIEQF